MKHLLGGLMVAGMALGGASIASSVGPNTNAKIEIHLAPTTSTDACSRSIARPECNGIVTHGNLFPSRYFAYVLVVHANTGAGVAGVQFGIDYGSGQMDGAGIDIYSWTLCGDAEYPVTSPVWPESGSGTLITWDSVNNCQRYVPPGDFPDNGVCADAGYFYLTAYDAADIHIAFHPADSMTKVTDCAGTVDDIEGVGVTRTPPYLGYCGFSEDYTHLGYSPCVLDNRDPVEPTTWGAIKGLYGGN